MRAQAAGAIRPDAAAQDIAVIFSWAQQPAG